MTIHRRISISIACIAVFATLSQGCFGLSDRRDGGSQDGDVASPMDVPNAVVDAPNAVVDSGVCSMGTVVCGASGCVNLQLDPAHCGRCEMACPNRANAMASCTAGACRSVCNAGFTEVGGQCLADGAFPRPILPISLGDVSLRRPTLRWELPAGADGAEVQLCRDRACTVVIETIRAMGTSVRPITPLPASIVVFWRLRATVGAAIHMPFSPTWLFHVPATDNTGGVDTSANPHVDVNGDGFDDVVVGANGASPGDRTRAGTASVFHGSVGRFGMAPANVLEGVAMRDNFGISVASAGDVNGDGFGDLIIGAFLADPGGRADAGTASVFYGSAMGISMAPAIVLEGVAPDDQFGISVAGAGDVNGDGFADVVVGAWQADPVARADAGTASVFYGSAMGVAMAPARVLEGATEGDNFGISVASAGDVNGDGLSDLVIGASSADPRLIANAGTASVYYGSAMGVPGAPARVLGGVGLNDKFGNFVASAGDMNSDGFGDLVIAASAADPGGRIDAGTASVFLGSVTGVPAASARVFEGVAAGDRFGISVASAGDVNGDGVGDLIVGAYNASPGGRANAGTASLYYGSAMGVPMGPTRVLEGVTANYFFGASVAGAGDVNGDGFGDLVIGSVGADPGARTDAGTASVFYGAAMGISIPAARVLEGVGVGDTFGRSVARARRVVRVLWRS